MQRSVHRDGRGSAGTHRWTCCKDTDATALPAGHPAFPCAPRLFSLHKAAGELPKHGSNRPLLHLNVSDGPFSDLPISRAPSAGPLPDLRALSDLCASSAWAAPPWAFRAGSCHHIGHPGHSYQMLSSRQPRFTFLAARTSNWK